MRALFLLLLAANLALFAWTRYYASPDGAADAEPQRRQIKPESIRMPRAPSRRSRRSRWARAWRNGAGKRRPAGGCSSRRRPTARLR